MAIDLEQHKARADPFRSQICIVGAGIAGLTLAHHLTQQGIDVALLEAGGPTLESAGQSLLTEAQLSGTRHVGTHEGRFRAFGGASLRWGGQLLVAPSSDTDLVPQYRAAESLLAVDNLPYDAALFFADTHLPPPLLTQLPGLEARLSKWAPFDHRNLAQTLGRDLLAGPRAQVFLHAQATELLLALDRTHLEAVLVRTLSGATFRFEAQHFILAAGTVETVRLLLASCSIAPEGVGNAHDQVGRNFHDHLTLPAATFTGSARAAILDQGRPWLFHATQHSLKLEASPALCAQLYLNPVLAHLTLEEPEDSGLAIVRDLLTARQRGDFARTLAAHTAHLPSVALESLRLAYEAKFRHRRFVSAQTTVRLQLNAAQDTPSASRITLSSDLDPFGLPQPTVDWRITANELSTLRTFAGWLREHLQTIGPKISWNSDLFTPGAPLQDLTDARHAMGGACMGLDPRSSVVDANLTVHGLTNLHIASPAVFPDGSAQLPTLPLMALTLRLAERLADIA